MGRVRRAGQPVRAVVTEVTALSDTSEETDGGPFGYRVAGAATEQDLGRLLYGLPDPAPVGTVVEVSVVPGAAEYHRSARSDSTPAAHPYVTAFGVMTAVHLLARAAAWAGWPRRPG
ncbi:hypothetical protein ACFZDK_23165 [Streptomyces sp. NPDC007901]|uniref:hypothetical protein n=1 Tax=Streptomyces sp. NPDC007901 TaxID=3364785 RepID=UPI0036E79B25